MRSTGEGAVTHGSVITLGYWLTKLEINFKKNILSILLAVVKDHNQSLFQIVTITNCIAEDLCQTSPTSHPVITSYQSAADREDE